jgi:septal ring factor EnvC (AmiA/AmiB activator)
MTIEERFERIEHVTAGIAEERRKDREEYRQLWRDQQRQIDEMNRAITRMAEESRADHQRWRQEMHDLREEMHDLQEEALARDQRLGERIDALVSAMGEFLSALPKPGKSE